MKRHFIAAILALAVAGLGWLGYDRTGRLRPVARVDSELVSPPVGHQGWVAWIESASDGSRLMAARGGRRAREVARGDLSGLAVSHGKAFVGSWPDDPGLLAVSLRDGRSDPIAQVAGPVQQAVVAEEVVYWLERREAALPGVPFAFAAGPFNVLRSAPVRGGQPSLLAVIPGGQQAFRLRPRTMRDVDLIGAAAGRAYWAERKLVGGLPFLHLRRSSAPGGKPETLVVEPGEHSAALADGALVWTAFSRENAIPEQHAAVRRLPLEGGETQVIADWLAPDTVVLGSGKSLYAQQQDLLWRLGPARGSQRVVYQRTGPFVAAALVGDREYLVKREEKDWAVSERPLTWWARVRRLVGG